MGTGEGTEAGELSSALYGQLHDLASRHVRARPLQETLQPTALVHEACLKLGFGADEGRTHFLALASRVMRQVLVDHARARAAVKRGGSAHRTTLSNAGFLEAREVDVLALHEALEELERLSPDKVRLVELRFFGGLTEDEAAAELGISRASATRQWRFVRSWLARRLANDDA